MRATLDSYVINVREKWQSNVIERCNQKMILACDWKNNRQVRNAALTKRRTA